MLSKMRNLRTAACTIVGLAAFSGAATAGNVPGMVGHDFATPPSVQKSPQATSKLCKIGGVWNEWRNRSFAATVTLNGKKGKKGKWVYSGGCTFKVVTSDLTQAGFNAAMTPEKTQACDDSQCFSESLQFQGSCDSVAGTFTNCDGSGGDDSWTKQ